MNLNMPPNSEIKLKNLKRLSSKTEERVYFFIIKFILGVCYELFNTKKGKVERFAYLRK